MKITNTNYIKSEDFEDDSKAMIDQLADTFNPLVQEISDLADGRIDFENRVEVLKTVTVTVDSSGNPTTTSKVKTDRVGIRGIQVIQARNTTNPYAYPTGQPFVSYSVLTTATGLININNITGLVANHKYELTLVIY